jgi:hypothetical protein
MGINTENIEISGECGLILQKNIFSGPSHCPDMKK